MRAAAAQFGGAPIAAAADGKKGGRKGRRCGVHHGPSSPARSAAALPPTCWRTCSYDLANTNVGMLGTDLEKAVRQAAAEHEDAVRCCSKPRRCHVHSSAPVTGSACLPVEGRRQEGRHRGLAHREIQGKKAARRNAVSAAAPNALCGSQVVPWPKKKHGHFYRSAPTALLAVQPVPGSECG